MRHDRLAVERTGTVEYMQALEKSETSERWRQKRRTLNLLALVLPMEAGSCPWSWDWEWWTRGWSGGLCKMRCLDSVSEFGGAGRGGA
jgi:hypothetical protein